MRSRRQLLALLVAGGCGRIAFDPHDDAAVTTEGSDAAAACERFSDWRPPVLAVGLESDQSESGGQVTADGLGFYFARDNRLYAAHRPDRTSAWTAALITDLDFGSAQYDATVTGDELEIFFTRAEAANAVCVYHASRTSKSLPWSLPERLDELCTTRDAGGAYVTADGLTLLYTPVMGGGEGTIYITTRPDRSARFPAGAQVDGLPGLPAGTYGYAALAADQLTLYFEADSPLDIYTATRSSTAEPWSAAAPLAIANSSYSDEDVSITADGKELYFDSDRPSTRMRENVYVSTRECL